MRSGIGRSISVAFAVLLGVAVLVLIFRAPKPFPFVGDWSGIRNVIVKPGADPAIATSLGEVQVRLYDTGRFDLTTGGLDYSGQVTYDGDSATLVPDKLEGMSMDRQPEAVKKQAPTVHLKVNPDGKTLTETETITGVEPVVLKRQQR